jgi:two-component system response regulator NreC
VAIRILVADDHALIRHGLQQVIGADPELQIVGEAADTETALRLARELQPDVVLMDVSMPGAGGIEATRQLRLVAPQVHVLILTVHEETSILSGAIEAGAVGYIVKRAMDTELIDAVRAVARGDLYLHPAVTRTLLGERVESHTSGHPNAVLTPRAREVLRLLARGYTNRQIAEELRLSVRTVEGHRAHLMAKLGLQSRVDLVTYAEEHGLLD